MLTKIYIPGTLLREYLHVGRGRAMASGVEKDKFRLIIGSAQASGFRMDHCGVTTASITV